jgi:periplasmic glucans biosynthesis protein
VMEIDCALYPRRSLAHVGVAPFSSMFYFGPADHTFHDDFRPRVHDSDGLIIHTGSGEWIWRPLVTAPNILYSVFSDKSPKGFGLMQRQRQFDHYQDINAGYERRPSAWIEPLSDWGEGSVDLIEIPTGSEYTDNIVAFWRPKQPLEPGEGYPFRYRLTWCWHVPGDRDIAQILLTRTGAGLVPNSRYFVIDFAGGDLYSDADIEHWDYEVSATAGAITVYTVANNPFIDGKRIALEYHPEGEKPADLSFLIRRFGKPLTEKWVYRWAR